MSKVTAKRARGEIAPPFPIGLKAEPCGICGGLVVWVARVDRRIGRFAIDHAPGNVAIQTSLLCCAPTAAPCAYEVSNATPYRWHVCAGSFVGQSRPRKVRA